MNAAVLLVIEDMIAIVSVEEAFHRALLSADLVCVTNLAILSGESFQCLSPSVPFRQARCILCRQAEIPPSALLSYLLLGMLLRWVHDAASIPNPH